jgi:hypothetical protein
MINGWLGIICTDIVCTVTLVAFCAYCRIRALIAINSKCGLQAVEEMLRTTGDDLAACSDGAKQAGKRLQREFRLHAMCSGTTSVIKLLGGIYSPDGHRLYKLVQQNVAMSLEALINSE